MNLADNELVNNLSEAPTESSGSLIPTSKALFHDRSLDSTPGPALALGSTLSFAPTIDRYIDEDLERATKLALEFFLQD